MAIVENNKMISRGENKREKEKKGERSDQARRDHELDISRRHTLRIGVLDRLLLWLIVLPIVTFPDTYGGKLLIAALH